MHAKPDYASAPNAMMGMYPSGAFYRYLPMMNPAMHGAGAEEPRSNNRVIDDDDQEDADMEEEQPARKPVAARSGAAAGLSARKRSSPAPEGRTPQHGSGEGGYYPLAQEGAAAIVAAATAAAQQQAQQERERERERERD
jgi:hypothetical protein